MTNSVIHIIGAGLAGSEAAWQVAEQGLNVILHEMRPTQKTDAHQTEGLAELVCSNSFRSDDYEYNAVGLLHEEMRQCHSLIMMAADKAKVPAGSALAVDRDVFSNHVTQTLETHPNITIKREMVEALPTAEQCANVIVATGPLTHSKLAADIIKVTGEEQLAFFDAIAPIVHKDSIDFDTAWFQSRYDKIGPEGDGKDYINCPMTKPQYETFIQSLINGDQTEFKDWEKDTPYFEACLPIEVMAERGPETLRFGPMKPVGLTNPHSDEAPYAVVQLRQDNKLGTLYNIVGFQTKLKYGAQTEIFRTIPGLENAQFARLGGIHRNTFIKSPVLLDETLALKSMPHIRFAGQITGCEGYVESASVGLMAGRFAAAKTLGIAAEIPPETTALGALLNHITGGADSKSFQPMNINFGLFPPIPPKITENGKKKKVKGRDRKKAMSDRALTDLQVWLSHVTLPATPHWKESA